MIDEKMLAITVEECRIIMEGFDEDGNGQLDRREFDTFLSRFAEAASVPLSEVVDFLMVKYEFIAVDKGLQNLPTLFAAWDKDGGGTLDREEIQVGIDRLIDHYQLKMSQYEVSDIMDTVDINFDGQLDKMEFGCFLSRFATSSGMTLNDVTTYLIKSHEHISNEKGWRDMPKLFEVWDGDKSGSLDRVEIAIGIQNFLTKSEGCEVTLIQCLQIMDEVDDDGNRELCQMEFSAFLSKFASASGIPLGTLTSFLLEEVGNKKCWCYNLFDQASVGLVEETVETLRHVKSKEPKTQPV